MMKKINHKFLPVALGILLALWGAPAAADTESRFEDLARRYGRAAEVRAEAGEFRRELVAEADKVPPYGLWRSLFQPGRSARQGAANALALLSALVEGGDPARWETSGGFFHPSMVPKALAAADGIYMAAYFLLRLDDEGAAPLASYLLGRFIDSPRGKHFFIATGPEEYKLLTKDLAARELTPSFGVWPDSETRGRLPFAAPVRGWVSQGRATTYEMVFLDGAGRPQGNGRYAWDRKRGRIYEVVEERTRIFLPWN